MVYHLTTDGDSGIALNIRRRFWYIIDLQKKILVKYGTSEGDSGIALNIRRRFWHRIELQKDIMVYH